MMGTEITVALILGGLLWWAIYDEGAAIAIGVFAGIVGVIGFLVGNHLVGIISALVGGIVFLYGYHRINHRKPQ